MLNPFIIDQIRRLQDEKRQQQPQLELELPRPIPYRPQEEAEDERGVFAIELL